MNIRTIVGGDFKSTASTCQFAWPPKIVGDGISVFGTVNELRNHTVKDSSNKHHRYVAIVVDIGYYRSRLFKDGSELEPPIEREKAIAKGWLNQFDHKTFEDPDKITADQWLLRLDNKANPYWIEQNSQLHPNVKDRFEFWGETQTVKAMDLKKGDQIRLKTKGDSIIIESCSKLNQQAQNYSGEDVLGGWTNKINASKLDDKHNKPLPGSNMEGVDEAEWD